MNEHTIEKLAQAIHADYAAKMRDAGQTNHPNAVEWDALPDEFKESNRAQARDIGAKLAAAGFFIDAGGRASSRAVYVESFDPSTTLLLARFEHDRWMKEKLANGWVYAPVRDNAKKHHPCLVPYEELSLEEQQKDINVVNNIIPLLTSVGLRVCKAI